MLYGRCDDELPRPFQPFAEPLRRLPAGAAPASAEILRTVEAVPPIVSEASRASADPGARHRLFGAVTDLLEGLARPQPLLLVLDDLHWADSATLLLLRHIAREAPSAPVLVIATYRDAEVEPGSWFAGLFADITSQPGCFPLALGGIDPAAVEELASGKDLPATVARPVHARTGGNPFFVHEVLRQMSEASEAGRSGALPAGGSTLVERRLGRLPRSVRDVLTVAAFVRTDVDPAVVADVAQRDIARRRRRPRAGRSGPAWSRRPPAGPAGGRSSTTSFATPSASGSAPGPRPGSTR